MSRSRVELTDAELDFYSAYQFWQLVPVPSVLNRPLLDGDLAGRVMRAATPSETSKLEVVKKRIGELRQREWPAYIEALKKFQGEPRKGDWQDPTFFDFMSWVQHVALCERLPASDARKWHDGQIADDVLKKLDVRIENQDLVAALKTVLARLVNHGFAARARLLENFKDDPEAFRCDLALPANLWSGAALDKADAPFRNDLHLLVFNKILKEKSSLRIIDVDRKASSDGKVAHCFTVVPITGTTS